MRRAVLIVLAVSACCPTECFSGVSFQLAQSELMLLREGVAMVTACIDQTCARKRQRSVRLPRVSECAPARSARSTLADFAAPRIRREIGDSVHVAEASDARVTHGVGVAAHGVS